MARAKKYTIIGIVILGILLFSCYSPKYVYRVLAWQESDYNDFDKFDYTTIKTGAEVFAFHKSTEKQSAKERQKLKSSAGEKDLFGFLEQKGTYSFLVIRNDTILIEKYFNQNNRTSLQNTFSASKSILALAVMKAVELRMINSIKDPIVSYIPELLERNESFNSITIGDLLRMKSGISYSSQVSFPWINRDSPMTYYHPDLRYVAVNKTQIDNVPDSAFLYNNYNPLLLGLIMERATKMNLSEFTETHLWSKIGTEFDARWSTDDKAFEKMESGFLATPIDLAKVGRLVLKKGEYNGVQILPQELIEEFTKTVSSMKVYEDRIWGYGHFWWTLPDGSSNPSIMANGHLGQFIFINPKTNYIVIRNGLKKGKFYDDDWVEIFKKHTKE